MFQSYKYQKYLGIDPETKRDQFQYKITDSDFEEVGVEDAVGVEVVVEVVVAVIDVYEKRNLNVAANLIAAILWFHKLYPHYSIQQIIELNRKDNPKFAPYEKEALARLEKLLPLL